MNPSEGIVVLAASIPAPAIDYGLIAPILIVFAAAVVGVLVESFAPASARYLAHVLLTTGALVAAFVAVVMLAGTRATTLSGAVVIDGPALFLQGSVLIVAVLSVALVAERSIERVRTQSVSRAAVGAHLDAFAPQASAIPGTAAERQALAAGGARTEVFPLMLFAVGGMLVFPASNDLLTMFVALEVLSLPLYLLCGLARRRRLLSQEAALKYFLLGAFSSAFFLYGVAMLYGYAGTVHFGGIALAIDTGAGSETTALVGVGLLAVGLLFKIGAVPFHSWTPDVYQAHRPRDGVHGRRHEDRRLRCTAARALRRGPRFRRPVAADPVAVAIATMVVGAVLAVTQNDIKRMLAYSAISHTGFVLTGVVAGTASGISSTLFYLLVYGIGTVGVFAVVTLVRDPDGEAWELSRWAGVGRRSPLLGGAFALFLLSLAGIPLTSGFIAKFAVFGAAIEGGAAPLVIVGVLISAIAAYFYVRVIVLMFFTDPTDDAPRLATSTVATSAAIAFAAVATVLLGILPQPVLDLAERAAVFVL